MENIKRNNIYVLHEFLITQMNYLAFYPLILAICVLFKDIFPITAPISLIQWMLLGIIPFGLYIVRCHVKQFLPFLLLHCAAIALFFLLPACYGRFPWSFFLAWQNPLIRVLALITGCGFVIYSMYLRLHASFKDDVLPMPLTIGMSAVCLYMQHYRGNKAWDSNYKISLILVIGLFFLAYYVGEYLNFLVVNANSTGVLPEKEIFRSGLKTAILYTMGGMGVLFFTSQFSWLRNILALLKSIVYTFLRFIFSLFPPISNGERISYASEALSGNGGMPFPEAAKTAFIWKVIETIAFIAFAAGVMIALFRLLKWLISYIQKAMKQVFNTNKKELTTIYDVREKCEPVKKLHKAKPRLSLSILWDHKAQIRHIYKKTVSGYKPNPLTAQPSNKSSFSPDKLQFYTAREMELEMKAAPFSAIYNKARYSNLPCGNEDVKQMKELSGNRKGLLHE